MKLHILLTSLLASAATAVAADLRAPGEKPITLGSEMDRGALAVSVASQKEPRSLTKFFDRVVGIQESNQLGKRDSDGFLLGLHFQMWYVIDRRIQTGRIPASEPLKPEDIAATYFLDFRFLQSKLTVTDEQLAGCGLYDGEGIPAVIARIKAWDEQLKKRYPPKKVKLNLDAK